jgi:hypothetical protein
MPFPRGRAMARRSSRREAPAYQSFAREAPIPDGEKGQRGALKGEGSIERPQGKQGYTPQHIATLQRLDRIWMPFRARVRGAVPVSAFPDRDVRHSLGASPEERQPFALLAWMNGDLWRFSPGEAPRVATSPEELASPGEKLQGLAPVREAALLPGEAPRGIRTIGQHGASPGTLPWGNEGKRIDKSVAAWSYPVIGVDWGRGKADKDDENRIFDAGLPSKAFSPYAGKPFKSLF